MCKHLNTVLSSLSMICYLFFRVPKDQKRKEEWIKSIRKTLERIQTYSWFKEFAIHTVEDVSSLQMDHSLLLINAIIHKYVKIRLYHESKMFTLSYKKENKRQLYNKLMLHSGV